MNEKRKDRGRHKLYFIKKREKKISNINYYNY